MKRGMSALLFLVLLTSLAWGAEWYRFQGRFSGNYRTVTGETERISGEVYVLLSYQTVPWSISFEDLNSNVLLSGKFDQDQQYRKLQFRASAPGGTETLVGRGSANAKYTTLNLQGWAVYQPLNWPVERFSFGQVRFRGAFVDVINK